MRALRASQAFDGERFIGPVDVVLDDDGRIAEVSLCREHGSAVPVEDLGEATLLPGLIDAHQHLSWSCSPDPLGWHEASDDATLLETGSTNANRALAAGITTVRDLGARGRVALDLRDKFAGDPSSGPRVLAAGAALTTVGGHCHFLGGECSDLDELVAAVGRLADSGVDVIKVMATGGNVTPGSLPHESQFGAAELRAVVEAARARGLPVAAHAHGTGGVVDALDAGVDTIEHCTFMTAEGIAQDPALIERLAASGTPVVLTAGSLPGPMVPAIAARMPALLAHVGAMLGGGVRCVLATDAGIGPPKPHDVLVLAVLQVGEMVGVPTAQALTMCTSRAADALAIGDEAGRLLPGRAADLLAVDGRLDVDPGALSRPVRVLRRGIDVLVGA
ncbi:imidazolonepropionase-like amidohydrolase [Humibacillus xanthopallidus]|uniref:Imidazolonepropionase-like amidohydrolase n=1 Tax=Humibacillus xanthopallidus TaxID=412689 RepID=A0A543PTU2_9MICO|nr:amidohydrolase family protein [Humibacillus xanthopallidus]TQN47507.1 imidazolonepropionase-like amidohydrolase [Humibacillus xanthopallidus]